MRIGRKLPAAVAVIGLAAGLTLVGPSNAGAQAQIEVNCVGADEGSQALIDAASTDFPNGYVPIPATINANVPAELQPGESADVSFSWELNPGDTLVGLAVTVAGLQTIEATLPNVVISQTGGTGGPYQFNQSATLNLQPPSFPVIEAGGQITAGDSPIVYSLEVGLLELNLMSTLGSDYDTIMYLDCAVAGNSNVAGTTVGGVPPENVVEGGGGSGSGSGGGASTTIGRGTTGTANQRVTG